MGPFRPLLLGACGVLFLLVLWVYLRGDGDTSHDLSPDELLQQALTLPNADDQVRAAVKLADYCKEETDYERLESRMREVVVPQLRELAAKSTNVAARCVAMQGLATARDWESLPTLFAALEDADPVIRGRAGQAVQYLLGADYYYKAEDPPAQRARVVAAMREYYEARMASNGGKIGDNSTGDNSTGG